MTLSAAALTHWGELIDRLSTPGELERQAALLTREIALSDQAGAELRRLLGEVRTKQSGPEAIE